MRVDFVIVTALEEERDAVLSKLPGWLKLPPTGHDVRVYFHAQLPVLYSDGTKSSYSIIVVCLPGMGRVEGVNTTKDAINRWKPSYVLLVGIAAGFEDNEATLGDVLVSDQIVDYELQKVYDEPGWLGRIFRTGPKVRESYRFRTHGADTRLIQAAQNFIGDDWISLMTIARPMNGKPTRIVGPMATGDKVVERRALVKALLDKWPKLIGLEMEAGGVASACFQASTRPGFFMVRGASDLADKNKSKASAKQWRGYASDVAASYVIALLRSGPIPLDPAVSEFRSHTDRAINSARILIPGLQESIPRNEVEDVEDQLRLGRAVVLTGEPGTGKTGIGHMLAISARATGKEVLLLDARRVEHIKDKAELRSFFSLEESVSKEIGRMGLQGGCRLIIDQLDSVVTLPSASVLAELAVDCSTLTGVEVIVISRKREGHETKLLTPLTDVGFFELESRKLNKRTAAKLLTDLGIRSPSKQLIELAQNLLNLELIAKIKEENDSFDFSAIEDEVDLWEKYVEALTESDSRGDELLGSVVSLAKQALDTEDGSFMVTIPLSRPIIRLESWGVIVCEHGRIYRFGHEKLQDYFYAWDATQRAAMPSDIMHEINPHRSTSVLAWMKKIYAQHHQDLYKQFLKEAFDV
jgi:nucleoside phosphorylase